MDEEEPDMVARVEYYQSVFDNQILFARNEGWDEGRNEGLVEGEVAKSVKIAKKLLLRNRPTDEIVEDTGLTYEEVESLRSKA